MTRASVPPGTAAIHGSSPCLLCIHPTLTKLLETGTGLLPLAPQNDAQLPSVTRGKWGRGNGWFASGMAEILQELDPGHEHYSRILLGFTDMMSGLIGYQRESGLWQQVIDEETGDNWDETSGSSMFTFAFVTGVKLGLLDRATYAPAARKVWLALADMVDSSGNLQNVSQWCYAPGGDSVSYYLGRAKETGNDHGQAPLLWAAAALLK